MKKRGGSGTEQMDVDPPQSSRRRARSGDTNDGESSRQQRRLDSNVSQYRKEFNNYSKEKLIQTIFALINLINTKEQADTYDDNMLKELYKNFRDLLITLKENFKEVNINNIKNPDKNFSNLSIIEYIVKIVVNIHNFIYLHKLLLIILHTSLYPDFDVNLIADLKDNNNILHPTTLFFRCLGEKNLDGARLLLTINNTDINTGCPIVIVLNKLYSYDEYGREKNSVYKKIFDEMLQKKVNLDNYVNKNSKTTILMYMIFPNYNDDDLYYNKEEYNGYIVPNFSSLGFHGECNVDQVKTLIKYGANIYLKNFENYDALELALKSLNRANNANDFDEVVELIKIIKVLVMNGLAISQYYENDTYNLDNFIVNDNEDDFIVLDGDDENEPYLMYIKMKESELEVLEKLGRFKSDRGSRIPSRSIHSKSPIKVVEQQRKKEHIKCNNIFNINNDDGNNYFSNVLIKKCMSMKKTNPEENYELIRKALKRKHKEGKKEGQNKYIQINIELNKSGGDNKHEFEINSLYKEWNKNKNILRRHFDKYRITYEQEEAIDERGVRMQFFSNVASQSIKFFVIPESSSDRHIFNTNINPDEFIFLGELFAFLIINNIPLPYKISYQYLSRLLYDYKSLDILLYFNKSKTSLEKYKDYITDIDLLIYYYFDGNEETKQAIIYMLNEINNLEDVKDMKEYFDGYIKTINLLTYGYDGNENTIINKHFNNFLTGFYIPKKTFRVFKKYIDEVSVIDIDNILSSYYISNYLLNERVVKPLKIKYKHMTNELLKNIYKLMIDLLSADEKYYDKMNEKYMKKYPLDTNAEKYKEKKVFIAELLKFWSGAPIPVIKKEEMHIDLLEISEDIDDNNRLMKASTCFNKLKIYNDVVDENILYNRLIKSIMMSGNTFGLE